MRIAIDASRTTVARVTGTERYALELIRALLQQNTKHEIALYFRDNPAPDLFSPSDESGRGMIHPALIEQKVLPFRRAWTHLRFAAELWRDQPDVTFVPAHTLPLVFPGKALVTLHDLGFKHFPEAHPLQDRRYLDWTTRFSAWRASLILADSQATADDLTRFYGTRSHKIRIIYPGVIAPSIRDVNVREKYHLPERYFVFIGTLQPRKNIARIVQAYAQYRAQSSNPAGLVLAGGKGWLYDERWTADVEGVMLTGYIDEADKGALLAGAVGMVFTTLYEGFGFPVLEAMHCGTPVIASTTSSLPELVGDAGIQVNPLDVNAISTAIRQVDEDSALRTQLIAEGYKQVRQFTWENAASQLLRVFDELSS